MVRPEKSSGKGSQGIRKGGGAGKKAKRNNVRALGAETKFFKRPITRKRNRRKAKKKKSEADVLSRNFKTKPSAAWGTGGGGGAWNTGGKGGDKEKESCVVL